MGEVDFNVKQSLIAAFTHTRLPAEPEDVPGTYGASVHGKERVVGSRTWV